MTGPAAPESRPTPILYVHYGLDWITGSERCLLDLVAQLDRRRFTPILWCNAPALLEAASALGVIVYRSPEWGEHTSLFPDYEHVRAAREIIQRHEIGLIHSNDAAPLRALVPAARSERVPLLAQLHLRLTSTERRWSWVHQVSLAVGVSEASARGLREDGFPPNKTTVIYNGVDPIRLARGDARYLRDELGIRADDIVFTLAGSLILRKGIDVALAAARMICERRTDCHLLVCGDGPLEAELRALANSLGVADHVHFLGRRSDVGAVFRDATDVLIAAAREESFGLTIAEAAVFGVPAIASAIDAQIEVVADGGILFPPGDAHALANAMEALAADPGLRQRLGTIARSHAERSFLMSRNVSEFERAYERLLSRSRASYGWLRSWSWPTAYTTWAGEMIRRRLARLARRERTTTAGSAP